MLALKPYLYLALGLAVIGVFFYGVHVGKNGEIARVAQLNDLVEDVEERAQRGAADAIAKNKPIHKTIQTQAETVIREKTVYRDCVHDPAVERLLNDARANRAPAKPVGNNGVSGTGGGATP